MPIIVVPDDEPPVLAGTAEEERLRQLGEVRIYDSRPFSDEELLPRIADANVGEFDNCVTPGPLVE